MATTDTIFERLIAKLVPTGRAWWQLPQKIMTAIFGGIADELQQVRTAALLVKNSPFPQEMDTQFIPDWENRFKLPAADLTEQERRDRLEAQWQPGGQTFEFIEQQLQAAGFDVYVMGGSIAASPEILGDIVLGDFVLEGNIYDGQVVTRCTTVSSPNRPILGDPSFILGDDLRLELPPKADPCQDLVGEVTTLGDPDFILGDGITLGQQTARFIVNSIDEQFDPSTSCPVDEGRCIFIFFIQGPGGYGDMADIPVDRYSEFRELVLKIKPGHTWAAAFVNLV